MAHFIVEKKGKKRVDVERGRFRVNNTGGGGYQFCR